MEESLIATQFSSAAVVVWIIQYLKSAGRLAWITQDTGRLNRVISAVLALATAAGIHYQFDSTAGTLTVTGLTLTNGLHFMWAAAQQFIGQELLYEAVYSPKKVRG